MVWASPAWIVPLAPACFGVSRGGCTFSLLSLCRVRAAEGLISLLCRIGVAGLTPVFFWDLPPWRFCTHPGAPRWAAPPLGSSACSPFPASTGPRHSSLLACGAFLFPLHRCASVLAGRPCLLFAPCRRRLFVSLSCRVACRLRVGVCVSVVVPCLSLPLALFALAVYKQNGSHIKPYQGELYLALQHT